MSLLLAAALTISIVSTVVGFHVVAAHNELWITIVKDLIVHGSIILAVTVVPAFQMAGLVSLSDTVFLATQAGVLLAVYTFHDE